MVSGAALTVAPTSPLMRRRNRKYPYVVLATSAIASPLPGQRARQAMNPNNSADARSRRTQDRIPTRKKHPERRQPPDSERRGTRRKTRRPTRIRSMYPLPDSDRKSPEGEQPIGRPISAAKPAPGSVATARHPVEPNPPLPRGVGSSAATSRSAGRSTGAITNCAMRAPRLTEKAASPKLARTTSTSPR